MSDGTRIEWTDATWNPVTGCSVVSPGCTNCYAMQLAGTRLKHHPSRAGLTKPSKAGPVWTGEVRFNEQWLDQPLRWTRPRMVFVCAHGDLFHESVPDGWIMSVFDVMWRTPWHTYQVLTKRPDRMRAFIARWCDLAGEDFNQFRNARGPDAVRKAHPSGRGQLFAAWLDTLLERSGGKVPDGAAWPTFDWAQGQMWWPNVPRNVWLGVSAEDQQRADERIPELLDTPAAVRFVSLEPLLGPIDLRRVYVDVSPLGKHIVDTLHGTAETMASAQQRPARRLDWIIVGGESGKGARPMHPDWARAIRDQCTAAGVPFFFKQWGEWAPRYVPGTCETDPPNDATQRAAWHDACGIIKDTAANPDPLDFWCEGQVYRLGKARAGRALDGREWSELPGTKESVDA